MQVTHNEVDILKNSSFSEKKSETHMGEVRILETL